jgi:hypothetical protein
MELKEKILANIDKFKIAEFCPNGGRPKFDNLEVLVFSEEKKEEATVFSIGLIYECEIAGCCFIPGGDNHAQIQTKVKITETSFEVLT